MVWFILAVRAEPVDVRHWLDWNDVERKQDEDQVDVHVVQQHADIAAAIDVTPIVTRTQARPLVGIGGKSDRLFAPVWRDPKWLASEYVVRARAVIRNARRCR